MFALSVVKVENFSLNLEITEVEITLYSEALTLGDLGTFFYHSDCWKDSTILTIESLSTLSHGECDYKGDSLLPKPKGELTDQYLLSMKIFHPITTCLLGKLLINDFFLDKNEQVFRILI